MPIEYQPEAKRIKSFEIKVGMNDEKNGFDLDMIVSDDNTQMGCFTNDIQSSLIKEWMKIVGIRMKEEMDKSVMEWATEKELKITTLEDAINII